MKDFNATRYKLKNIATERVFDDEGWTLEDKQSHVPSLIRAVYESKQIRPKGEEHGIYRFADWLPVKRTLSGSCAPVTYRSRKLAEHLGLKNLYITFNGYFPEIGARMTTCSFKETEAYSVCGRLNGQTQGQGARRGVGRKHGPRVRQGVLGQPYSAAAQRTRGKYRRAVVRGSARRLRQADLAPATAADYYDAIKLSDMALQSDKFFAEGGAKNVARRDGMATTVLSAVTHIGRIPDYYFQAVGSGTGAIAAWEANLRLIEDGRFGNHKMKLMVSQNAPFVPMYDAWKARSREMLPYDDDQARLDVEEIDAKVLSNRKPPYGIKGGCSTPLLDTGGDILVATNDEARAAKKLFAELEGVDIYSAPAVALATLIQSVRDGRIAPEEYVMLNVTGGGEKRFMEGKELFFLKPSHVFDIDPDPKEVAEKVEALFE